MKVISSFSFSSCLHLLIMSVQTRLELFATPVTLWLSVSRVTKVGYLRIKSDSRAASALVCRDFV